MCALTENADMAQDILDRVANVTSFLEEIFTEGRPPNSGLKLSSEALEGLVIITRDINQAVQEAKEKKW
jgi:hypothetical protein